MIAGCLLVFVPCFGAYLTPDLMGGGKTVMLGNLVQNQFTTARDWPFGAALSLIVMLIVVAVTRLLRHKHEEFCETHPGPLRGRGVPVFVRAFGCSRHLQRELFENRGLAWLHMELVRTSFPRRRRYWIRP